MPAGKHPRIAILVTLPPSRAAYAFNGKVVGKVVVVAEKLRFISFLVTLQKKNKETQTHPMRSESQYDSTRDGAVARSAIRSGTFAIAISISS